MAIEINTKISVGETHGKKVGNLILEDAKFWGRPNFSGELDRFTGDTRSTRTTATYTFHYSQANGIYAIDRVETQQ